MDDKKFDDLLKRGILKVDEYYGLDELKNYPHTNKPSEVIACIISNWKYFSKHPKHLAWAMMMFEICHRGWRLSGW